MNRPQLLPKQDPALVVVVGATCMLVGLGLGYYFGRMNAALPPAPSTAAPAAAPGPVENPADLLQQESALKAALAADPKNLDALIRLGNLYYDHQRWREAIDYYGRALDIDPKNPNVRTDRGTAYWNENKPDLAIAEFEKSLAADPAHAQTLYNLGVVHLHGKNDIEATRRAWRRLLETNPNYPDRARLEQQLNALSAPQAPDAAPSGDKSVSTADELLEKLKARK